jgi:hypothetical protein
MDQLLEHTNCPYKVHFHQLMTAKLQICLQTNQSGIKLDMVGLAKETHSWSSMKSV